MSDETTLLPCPFCGGEQTIRKINGHYVLAGTNHKRDCILRDLIPYSSFDTEAEAIAAWNARAERGTLTAEQVRETVEKHWHDLSADYDMPEATALPEYSYDWQAIADELNAVFGGKVER